MNSVARIKTHQDNWRATVAANLADTLPSNERSPEQFRGTFNAWHVNAPKNDSEIFTNTVRYSEAPRHRGMAKELSSLLTWRDLAMPVYPLQTNWMQADNDNEPMDEEGKAGPPSVECELEDRPSENEIWRAIEGVGFENKTHAKFGGGGGLYRVPVGGDIEYGPSGCIARLGALRLSTVVFDGGARNYKRLGQLTHFRARHGVSGTNAYEKFGTRKGNPERADEISATNTHFAQLLGASPYRYISGSRVHRPASKAIEIPAHVRGDVPLADARAQSRLRPATPPEDLRPALMCGSKSVSDSFVGCKVSRTGKSNELDPHVAHERLAKRKEAARLRGNLSVEDVAILDVAIIAANYEEVGEALGYTGKTAERQGRRKLLTAAKHLQDILINLAA